MPSKPSKNAKRSIEKPKGPSKAEARSNAAENQRLDAKESRVRTYMAEARKREDELTAQGYFF
jgi:hypothetical protein